MSNPETDRGRSLLERIKQTADRYGQPNAQFDAELVNALVEEFYALPGNDVGGLLHIVLDDGNTWEVHVEFCREAARKAGDEVAFWLSQLLLTFTDEWRAEALGFGDDDDDDDDEDRVLGMTRGVADVHRSRRPTVTVADRIRTGALPEILEGADWRRYRGHEMYEPGFAGWCRMWWGIAWVRLQAFEREADAEWEAEEHEAAIAAGGRW